jgi:hypothetical protein
MSITRTAASLGLASAVAVVCALQAGCIPYAYPNLMSVPAVRLDAVPEPIHAFRVEVKGREIVPLGNSTDDYALSRIDGVDGGRLPAQSDVSLEYGYPVSWDKSLQRGKTLLVRLYRPGYELVELRADDEAKVVWMPAVGLAAKERVIDDLLGVPAYSLPEAHRRRRDRESARDAVELATSVPEQLPPGSRSAKHHDALLFAAAEYERLAATPKLPEAHADRLRKKANDVRARAGQ